MTSTRPLKDPYPSQKTWISRKSLFTTAIGEALGDSLAGSSTPHARILEKELELVFCAGAWLATIVLACASVEVYVNGQDEAKEAKFLKQFGLRDDWIWLVNLRNSIVHPTSRSPSDPSSHLYDDDPAQQNAERAIRVALKVLLLGTRENLPTSSARDG